MDIKVGDTLALKKKHPCGAYAWRVLRIGADFKLRCSGCGHEILVSRARVEKSIKSIERQGE